MKIWVVTKVVHTDTKCHSPHVLGFCKSKEDATAFVKNDIEKWADDHAGEDIEVDFEMMNARHNGYACCCVWNMEEKEMNMTCKIKFTLDLAMA